MSTVEIKEGDCLEVMRRMAERGEAVQAVVTDPPYDLVSVVKRFGKEGSAPALSNGPTGVYARASRGFMGKQWDGTGIAFRTETWRLCYDLLPPGGWLLAFGGTRTWHRMAVAIEDAGFEVRDTICWLYGTGFPKSQDVPKFIDKVLGKKGTYGAPKSEAHAGWISRGRMRGDDNEEGWQRPWMDDPEQVANAARRYIPATEEARRYEGFGTALKPSLEPIVLARKPLIGTVAENVLAHGTGALNIDATRIPAGADYHELSVTQGAQDRIFGGGKGLRTVPGKFTPATGRWPANLVHDGSDEVEEAFAAFGERPGQLARAKDDLSPQGNRIYGALRHRTKNPEPRGDRGSASRFFMSCPYGDGECTPSHASDAESCFPLSSEPAVSALNSAVARSTQALALLSIGFPARSTNVTARELETICESVTTLIRSFVSASSPGQRPRRLSLSLGRVSCVAESERIGTMTITISHWRSDGSADPVTFGITQPNMDLGAEGSVSRFHYSTKATAADRAGSKHPTVKPIALLRWLARLVTPPGGTILDPFAGSGTTGAAALAEGFNAILIEREQEYLADIYRRFGMVPSVPVALHTLAAAHTRLSSILARL